MHSELSKVTAHVVLVDQCPSRYATIECLTWESEGTGYLRKMLVIIQ